MCVQRTALISGRDGNFRSNGNDGRSIVGQAGSIIGGWQAPETWQTRRSGFFLLAIGIVIFAVASRFFGTSEISKLAAAAVATAEGDSRVIDALGSPLTTSGSPGGRWTKTEASLIAPVRGSKGAGTLSATGVRTPHGWTLREVVVEADGGKRLIVVIEQVPPPRTLP
jgi:predicted dehydrogenase